MTRSTRTSTVTSTRASRSAHTHRKSSDSSVVKNTATRQSPGKSSPRSGTQSRTRHRAVDKQNGDESDEDSSEEEDEKPGRATRGTPDRKRRHDLESPQHKKKRLAKGTSNGTAENGVDETDTSDEESPKSEKSKSRTQNGNSEALSPQKRSNGSAKALSQVTKNSSQLKSKNSKKKPSKHDSDSESSTSDSEVIFSGTSRVAKKKAVQSLTASREYEEEDLEEISDSEEDDEDVEEISSDNAEEDDEEDEDDDEVEVIEMASKNRTASSSKFELPEDITIKDMQKLLKTMKTEYEELVKQKDDEIGRLRNQVKYKDMQLEDMNDLMTQNMELEAKISAILGSPDVYKSEVSALSGKKTKSPEKKERRSKESREEIKAEDEQNTPIKAKESPARKETSERKEKAKPKPSINSAGSDSDIEVITEDSPKERTSKRKRRSSVVEVQDEKDEPDTNKSTRPKRSRRTKVIEPEPEKIEALFVSDDEDEEIEVVKKGKKTKGKKEEKKVDEEEKGKKGKDNKEDENEAEDDKDKGRHKIRKLMADKKLKEETKAAAKEEKERLERVAKLKEKHQIVSHVDSKTKQPVYTKMVLAFKKDEKTPLVEVNTKILKKLKPHQVEAVEFLWDSMIETVDAAKKREPGSGCILAHCMGLGKTLSVITYVHTLLSHKILKLKTCLVVCPLNTVLNWQYEWQKWLDKKDRLPTYELASAKDIQSRTELLQKWHKEGGIMIMGYSLFRILATSTTKSKKKKKIFDESLNDPGADIIVCDEGHVLKNDASAISKCMNKVRSKRRIVLTGTPLQNNLIEYHCMVSFVKPNLLGTRREFSNRFVNPITNGQHADSTLHDVKVMKRRAHVLHKMLSGCVQRRDYSALTKFLPPKYEYILSIRLSPLQIQLYEKYLEKHQNNANPMFRGSSLFSDYQALMRIWTHPWVLKMDEIRQEKKMTYSEDDDDELGSFLASDTSEEEEEDEEEETTSKSSNEASESEAKEESEEELPPRRTRRSTSAKETETKDKPESSRRNRDKQTKEKEKESDSDLEEIFPDGTVRKAKLVAGEVIKHWQTNSRRKGEDEANPDAKRPEEQWWTEFINEEEHKHKLELSGKLVLLMDILRMCEGLGDKVLVFSQSLLSLDLIEDFLSYKNEEAEKLREGKKGKSANSIPLWKKDEDYCRMDGSTSAQNRSKQTNFFNCIKNKRMRLFLISTKAGGLGINLDSANRVIIFDASWNPSHDIQSIFRAYRFGQEKDVFIYRFLAQGTMEEKIYERQVSKESLSQRVIDEHQLDRHFTAHDLQELYRFQPDRLDNPDRKERPTPKVPKDVVLAELLSDRKEWLVGYHEHDSLLEKRPDEDLNEEERKAAWDDYEKEKQGFMYHYRQQQSAVTTYNYNYRPNLMNAYSALPNMNVGPGSASQPITVGGGGGAGASNSVAGGGLMPLVAPPAGFSSEQAKLNFQLSQLPRVVQEILKYNPDITPAELQTRLRAFMGMHTKYTNVPGFAMPEIFVTFKDGRKQIVIKKSNNSQLVGQPGVAMPSTTTSTSVSTTAALAAAAAFAEPSKLASVPATPSPAQLSAAISSSIASAATGAMPSRLPLPGRVPASQK